MTYLDSEPLPEWLARETPVAVLEPELPIIDPRHLWDLRKTHTEFRRVFETFLADGASQ